MQCNAKLNFIGIYHHLKLFIYIFVLFQILAASVLKTLNTDSTSVAGLIYILSY